jgi:hypothetical protein
MHAIGQLGLLAVMTRFSLVRVPPKPAPSAPR